MPIALSQYPLSGTIAVTQGYGGDTSHNNNPWSVDFSASSGTSVLAVLGGTVVGIRTGSVNGDQGAGGYGNFVTIQSNGFYTTYAHLTSDTVSIGQVVSAGTKIGTSGNTGAVTGPHIHVHFGTGHSGGAINQEGTGDIFRAYGGNDAAPPAFFAGFFGPSEVGSYVNVNDPSTILATDIFGTGNWAGSLATDSDELHGNGANNRIFGGGGPDRLYGEGGDDLLVGGTGQDYYDGGSGSDTVSFAYSTSNWTISLASHGSATADGITETLDNVENVVGGSGNDVITTSSENISNTVDGGSGNDRAIVPYAFAQGYSVSGTAASLVISGSAGTDTFNAMEVIQFSDGVTKTPTELLSGTSAGSISINDVTVSEGNSGTKSATFTVTRSGGTAAFSVDFATANGTATTSDGDYVAKSGTLSFGANVNTQTISITVNGDTKVEQDEYFLLNLSGATNGATISDSQGQGTITNDDAVNHAPSVTVQNISVGAGQSVLASSAITHTGDPDGDAIALYGFWDGGSGGGYFTVGGTPQAAGQWINVTAANLSTVRYVGGSSAGSETLYADVYDGQSWSTVVSFTGTTTAVNHAPSVSVQNITVGTGQSVAASSAIVQTNDADGDAIIYYAFYDGGSGGGYFTLNGAAQAAGQWITVTAANLSTVRYVGGSSSATENLYADVYDGQTWSPVASFTGRTVGNHAPSLTTQDISVGAGQSVLALSAIAHAGDADGDAIIYYAFYDGGGGGGYFTFKGAPQAAGQWIIVNAGDLSAVRYVGGSSGGSESLYADVYDGQAWSPVASFTGTTVVNHPPSVTTQDISVGAGQSVLALSAIVHAGDADGDAVVYYAFYDGGSGGGYFTFKGAPQAAGQWIIVNAGDLSAVRYVGGSTAGAENLYADVYDGQAWGPVAAFTGTTTDGGHQSVVPLPLHIDHSLMSIEGLA